MKKSTSLVLGVIDLLGAIAGAWLYFDADRSVPNPARVGGVFAYQAQGAQRVAAVTDLTAVPWATEIANAEASTLGSRAVKR